jgi:hypothetical protein
MRNLICLAALLLSATPLMAQGMDRGDRNLGLELNRDRSEHRIERLREDRQREEKARAEAEKKGVPAEKPVKPAVR